MWAHLRRCLSPNLSWSPTRPQLAFLDGMVSDLTPFGVWKGMSVAGIKGWVSSMMVLAGRRICNSRLMRRWWTKEGQGGHTRQKNSLGRLGWLCDGLSRTARRGKSHRIRLTRVLSTLTPHRQISQDAKRFDGTLTLAPVHFAHQERPMRRGNRLPRAQNQNSNRIRHQPGGIRLRHTADLLQPTIYPRFASCLRRLHRMGTHRYSSRRGSLVVAWRLHKDMDIGMVLRLLVS
jgi:hypothetical protein